VAGYVPRRYRRTGERRPLSVQNARPHQRQCRSNVVECYKFNDSFDKVECCFDIVAVFGNNVERNFVLSTKSSTKSKQIEHVQFVSTLSNEFIVKFRPLDEILR